MSNNNQSIMGKEVSDLYGSAVGRAIGSTTDIDGSIISVGIDRGYMGLLEVPFEHLVVQEDAIIYVPRWRLDSQKILREKAQVVRRLKALYKLIGDNDELKDVSKDIRLNYEAKLDELKQLEDKVRSIIEERLMELNLQVKTAKAMRFDANIQYKSSEMRESDFKKVKTGTSIVLERIDYEINEIKNQQRRLDELISKEEEMRSTKKAEVQVEVQPPSIAEQIPQPEYPIPEPPQDPRALKTDWLSRVSNQ